MSGGDYKSGFKGYGNGGYYDGPNQVKDYNSGFKAKGFAEKSLKKNKPEKRDPLKPDDSQERGV